MEHSICRRPLVTLGVCVRNSAHMIEDVVQSIAAQDFPHELMEVIFVDDGSRDKTYDKIVNHLPILDMESRVFRTTWKGLGCARNMVVRNALGKYIIWVDGDMLLPNNHVRKQVEFMESNPQIGAAKAKYANHASGNIVASLENYAYMAVDIKYGGQTTTRTLGTGGSIHCVDAIRAAGGFDETIRGVGEDMDLEYRIRKEGWMLYLGSPAFFYERRRKTWPALWREGFWHGYGAHYILRKDKGSMALYKLSPPAGFVAGLWYALIAYRYVYKKVVFLMPLQYLFKRAAWMLGFIKGQLDDFVRRRQI